MNNILKNKKIIILLLLFFVMILVSISFAIYLRIVYNEKYETAIYYFDNNEYDLAIEEFSKLGDYKDCKAYIESAEIQKQEAIEAARIEEINRLEEENKRNRYSEANLYLENENYEKAIELFAELSGYKDSDFKLEEAREKEQTKQLYLHAIQLFNEGDYENAVVLFDEVKEYKEAEEYIVLCNDFRRRISCAHSISAGIRYSAIVLDDIVKYSGESDSIKNLIKNWNQIISISSYGEYVVGLTYDGEVVVANDSNSIYRIDTGEWRDIVDICSGEMFIVGLKSDGSLTAQGHNGDGQINVDGWRDVVDIDSGWRHTVGLCNNGEVLVTGHGSRILQQQIEDEKSAWKDVVAISAGGGQDDNDYGYIIGLKRDGSVVAVGDNIYGRCNVSEWDAIQQISAGDFYAVGLKNDGTVICTSSDPELNNQVGEWKDIIEVSAGYNYIIAKDRNGNYFYAGNNRDGIKDYYLEAGTLIP